jgi:DNA-binding transcriptional ArsR family regulator
MSQKLVVTKGEATCPQCHAHLIVQSKVNGLGSKPQGDAHIRKITSGYKIEIICAYLNNPSKLYTTRDIIDILNKNRCDSDKVERSNITRPHSELLDAGIIIKEYKDGYDFYHRINVEKAKAFIE